MEGSGHLRCGSTCERPYVRYHIGSSVQTHIDAMARRHCTGRLLGGVALLAVSVLCNCGTSSRATAGLAFAQGLNPLALVVNLLLFQLPGLFLAAAGTLLAGVTVRYASGRLKYPIVISLVLMALFTAQKL
eukprot:724036-Amphidinium_carterae.1